MAPSANAARFLTLEDAKIAFTLFCAVFGIGSLGMPTNFARAGVVYGSIGIVSMGVANMYTCIVVSKLMAQAPAHVKTYGDIGEWCGGKAGRNAVLVGQVSICVMLACAFFVLGGNILSVVVPDTFSHQTWIVLMALMLLPVILTPTVKEGAGAALVGCLATIFSDLLALYVLYKGIHSSSPSHTTKTAAIVAPAISFKEVATMFGNLSLSYGVAVIVPALQREHSQPERIPRVVVVTLTVSVVLFLAIAVAGYALVGCQNSGNLLFTIASRALDFQADRGALVLAYLLMQLHIGVAMSVMMQPINYMAERSLLGMHQPPPPAAAPTDKHDTDDEALEAGFQRMATTPVVVMAADGNKLTTSPFVDELPPLPTAVSTAPTIEIDEQEQVQSEYKKPGVQLKYISLRCAILAVLTGVSVALHEHFLDIADFVGASAITLICVVLPVVFYLKRNWRRVAWPEKAGALLLLLVCTSLGAYVSYATGVALFSAPPTHAVNFPFCPKDYQKVVFTNTSYFESLHQQP